VPQVVPAQIDPAQLFVVPFRSQVSPHPLLKVTRESLDERTFQAAWSEGRAMPLQEPVQYALEQESA
jgi:hypothetical protein